MPLANTALGAYRNGSRIRRVYRGSTLLIGRTNPVVNPRFIGLSGWTGSGTGAVFSNPSDGGILRGRIAATVNNTAIAINGTAAAPVTPGQPLTVQALLRGTPGRVAQLRVTWTGATATLGPNVTVLSATTEQLASLSTTVPVGATAARADVRFFDAGILAGHYLEVRSVMLDRNTGAVRAYRDGTFPGWGWDGAADASVSSGWN